jgi:hypothetical protein
MALMTHLYRCHLHSGEQEIAEVRPPFRRANGYCLFDYSYAACSCGACEVSKQKASNA